MRLKALAATLALALVAAVPLLAQGPAAAGPAGPPGFAGPGHGPHGPHGILDGRMLRELTDYLDLSEAQVADAEQIAAAARQAIEPLATAGHDLHQQLRDALAADSPDAATVGGAVIAIHANRGEVRAVIDGAMADFEALLTEEQSARFDALRDARHTFGHHRRGHRPGGPGGEGGEPGQGPFAGPFGGEGGGPGAL